MADAAAPAGIINVYAPIKELKKRISVQADDYDQTMWHMLHVASRLIDRHCQRRFYVQTAAKSFDVYDVNGFTVSDLIVVNQMCEDRDGDGVYEAQRSRSDYILYPLNADPESPHGSAFERVQAVASTRFSGQFTIGCAKVQIAGKWGYRAHFVDAAARVSNFGKVWTAASRSMIVDDDTQLQAGHTILVDREQIFVKQVGANVLNVVRGLNGTMPANHQDGAPLRVLQYPAEVTEATILLAVDRWRRRDGAISGIAQNGSKTDFYDASNDVVKLLAAYRRLAL